MPLFLLFSLVFRRHVFQERLLVFSSVWSIATFLIYSCVSYKTPWLILSFTFPATLSLGLLIESLFFHSNIARGALYAVCLFSSVLSSLTFVFAVPYGRKNPYSYTHTHEGMIEAVKILEGVWSEHPEAKVLIGTHQYWPLPYYLRRNSTHVHYKEAAPRDFQCLFSLENIPSCRRERFSVIVLDSKFRTERPGWRSKYLRLSDVQEARIFVREKE